MTIDIFRPGGPRARSVSRSAGRSVFLGTIGVRHILDKVQAEGRFSVLEHPMSPRALASALHRHHNEDEYSWVIEGRVGALLGDEVLYGGPGDFIVKPRGQWHTFWNASDEPARILEIISPAGFEQFFDELAGLGGVQQISTENLDELCARYDLEMDVDSVPELCHRFGLRFPGEPL
ncbi:cupin domain-containing protein [Mycolicibacterium goodii]|uniref:cupin domain-containing protein n=1 Tax=Mycolicibacterium goodii TaxID=134601 RepID=UPI000AFA4B25|nr:cupin domain-containing protein [Mycolicibacterium goodii]